MSVAASRTAAAGLLAALLAALAVGAPLVNAGAGPPRAVFLQLPPDRDQPTIVLAARRLPSGRWRLTIETTGFRFTRLCVPDAEALPVGHAHVLLDGVRVASAYEPIVDLDALPPGRHVVSAVLRGQDHRALLGTHGLIKAEIVVEVPEA